MTFKLQDTCPTCGSLKDCTQMYYCIYIHNISLLLFRGFIYTGEFRSSSLCWPTTLERKTFEGFRQTTKFTVLCGWLASSMIHNRMVVCPITMFLHCLSLLKHTGAEIDVGMFGLQQQQSIHCMHSRQSELGLCCEVWVDRGACCTAFVQGSVVCQFKST